MHYEKPMVMELNARARVTGQTPNACIAGLAASNDETCVDGVSAGFSCVPGSGAGMVGVSCAPGSSPDGGWGDCADGISAFYCVPGVGGSEEPWGCRSGPIPIPLSG